ncbi:lysine--tRNA ligase [Patescibacteria group bacterium]|nr:lysine--tRNA ligase [Patescibacteria group bacterium]
MAEPIAELKKVRLDKLAKLREKGIEPFPAGWELLKQRVKTVQCGDLSQDQKVVVTGRVMGWRAHGKLIFADLRDDSGEIQICFREDVLSSSQLEVVELFDLGDFLGVHGELFQTKTGELTVLVREFKLLSKSLRPLPSEWYGLEDKEVRYRQRYVDLILNPDVKDVFMVRTEVLSEMRRILDEEDFLEVETPILQPVYGGASAKPFTTHHHALDIDLFLRISNELYLKRLIVGGFEKVYEVSKDFRNEGMDRQHNPEFTQIEFYWAYADYDELMQFTEKMIGRVLNKVMGSTVITFQEQELDFSAPIPRVSFYDLVRQCIGIDLGQVNSEKKLLKEIKVRKLALDLSGTAGYGVLVDKLYKEFCRPKVIQPTFLVDYPYETMPLAKRKKEEPAKIACFQLLAAGFELIKAYNELNDPIDQRERWEEMERLAQEGLEEHEVVDEDYLRALEYAMPPTAGWGMGIDRFVALITNRSSLKEVILFPTMRPENFKSSG